MQPAEIQIQKPKKAYPRANYGTYRPSKNPYYAKLLERQGDGTATNVFVDEASERNRGRWREHFKKPTDSFLQLELGAYHGETGIELAKGNPAASYVGIEWKHKVLYKGAEKAEREGLQNLCFLKANIARLPWIFAPGELDRVWILFPDPWSKLAQQKWRVFHGDFFRSLACLLGEGKEVMIKTDHKEYFEFMHAAICESGCFSPMAATQEAANWKLIPPTPFEKIFLRQGLPTYPMAFVRNTKPAASEWLFAGMDKASH